MNYKHITSLQHPLVKHLVKLRTDRDYRHTEQTILLEGIKPVQEVQRSIKQLICTHPELFTSYSNIKEKWLVTEEIMHKISGMTSSEGVVAEVYMPPLSQLQSIKWLLALDGINDPGNLGTLLRTALALGWEGVFLLPTSCDYYNEKVLRSARGAHFRLQLGAGNYQQLQQIAQRNQLPCFVADLKGLNVDQLNTTLHQCLLVLGNEAHGASKESKNFCQPIRIPMKGTMESLNVAIAGSILMYQLRD
jgi:TrmH family RNA methyltransferase